MGTLPGFFPTGYLPSKITNHRWWQPMELIFAIIAKHKGGRRDQFILTVSSGFLLYSSYTYHWGCLLSPRCLLVQLSCSYVSSIVTRVSIYHTIPKLPTTKSGASLASLVFLKGCRMFLQRGASCCLMGVSSLHSSVMVTHYCSPKEIISSRWIIAYGWSCSKIQGIGVIGNVFVSPVCWKMTHALLPNLVTNYWQSTVDLQCCWSTVYLLSSQSSFDLLLIYFWSTLDLLSLSSRILCMEEEPSTYG